MPLIQLKCDDCGYEDEELVGCDGKYPPCPKCGKPLRQDYNGKLTVNSVKAKACSGNCKTCGGCH